MDRADRSIKRCDLIISELLDYSRARSLKLEPTPIDNWINDVLEELRPITRQIIEQHGWNIDITGELQKGASVVITIPL